MVDQRALIGCPPFEGHSLLIYSDTGKDPARERKCETDDKFYRGSKLYERVTLHPLPLQSGELI